MMNSTHRAKINRELKMEERELIGSLLSHLPNPEPYLEQLDRLHVIGKCNCGCPTIDLGLADQRTRSSEVPQILIEADARSPEGIPVGIILWIKAGYVSELEVYPWEDKTNFTLPDPATLTNLW